MLRNPVSPPAAGTLSTIRQLALGGISAYDMSVCHLHSRAPSDPIGSWFRKTLETTRISGKPWTYMRPGRVHGGAFEGAESPAEGDQAGVAQSLAPENEDQMVQPRPVDRPEQGCVHVAGEIHAPDFGAKAIGYPNHLDAGGSVQRMGGFAYHSDLLGQPPGKRS